MRIPDEQYLQLYQMLQELLASCPAGDERRLVIYLPDLFVEMAQQMIKLQNRVTEQITMELRFHALQVENMSLRDDVRDLKREVKRLSK